MDASSVLQFLLLVRGVELNTYLIFMRDVFFLENLVFD